MRLSGVRRVLLIYGGAVVAVAATIALRWTLTPLIGDTAPLILLLLPVTLMSWIGGVGPGLFVAVLGTVVGLYWLVPPQPGTYHGWLPYPVSRTLPFVMISGFIAAFAAHLERARHRAAESEDRLRLIFESVQDYAIFTTDLRGNVTSWNVGAQRVFGYEESEILGQSAERLYTEPDLATALPSREMDKALVEGRAVEERWLVRKDGTRLLAGGIIAVLRDDAHQPTGFTRVCRDITEAKAAEQEREQLLISERAAREEAERVSRMKDEFLATLGHELRTPLNAILGWSQIMKNDPAAVADVTQGVDVIERNARAQAQIIDDLLDMSRIISGKVRLDVQRIDLSALVAAAVETCRPAADAKGVLLRTNVPPHESAIINGDPNRMQQVLWNLLTNAVKFTSKGGSVDVRLAQTPTDIDLTVTDTGEGIAVAFLPFVFDRFRQADASTTRRFGGLGLGLSIVKQLVELHGGKVAVASPGTGQGATFTVSLPLAFTPAPDEADDGNRSNALRTNSGWKESIKLTGLRVLVVDDEPDARALVRRLLEDRDAAVHTASNAAEAIALVRTHRPDIVVSDIGMPNEDGYVLIRQLRALEVDAGGSTPAIALTAYARAEDRVKAVVGGFQMHLAKPVEPAELIAMVATLTGRSSPR